MGGWAVKDACVCPSYTRAHTRSHAHTLARIHPGTHAHMLHALTHRSRALGDNRGAHAGHGPRFDELAPLYRKLYSLVQEGLVQLAVNDPGGKMPAQPLIETREDE